MDLEGFKGHDFSLDPTKDTSLPALPESLSEPLTYKLHAVVQPEAAFVHVGHANEVLLKYNETRIRDLRRCTRCILPETFPFIEYDAQGVCNYCRHYRPRLQNTVRKTGRQILWWRSAVAETAATGFT